MLGRDQNKLKKGHRLVMLWELAPSILAYHRYAFTFFGERNIHRYYYYYFNVVNACGKVSAYILTSNWRCSRGENESG